MSVLDRAELLLQTKNYSGSGAWLDESGNGHDAPFFGPLFLPYDGTQYAYFPGTADNTIQVTLAVATIYDYTITYLDATTDTGTATSDGGGVLVLAGTDAGFADKDVRLVDVTADGGGATLALFDAGLATKPFASFTDSIGKVWTINRSASGQMSTIVDRPTMLLDGVDDFFKIPSAAGLNFAANESFTVMVAYRKNLTQVQVLIDKRGNIGTAAAVPGYWMIEIGGKNRNYVDDGVAAPFDPAPDGPAVRELGVAAMVRNVVDDDIEGFLDGVSLGTPVTDTTTGTLANAIDFHIGAIDDPAHFFNGEIMAVVLWREALSDAEISEVNTELAARIIPIGIATETDTAFPITPYKPIIQAIGIATETDTALAITAYKPIIQAIGIASETDTAFAITLVRTVGIGIATETDTVFAITLIKPIIFSLGIAIEIDTALPIFVLVPTSDISDPRRIFRDDVVGRIYIDSKPGGRDYR
ncbi:MAG: hypothetical protein QGD93_09385 [Actinomycetota bacterium]|nr:hypothetical protein [Actinomycetota bacterium]